uniref:Uncharacterized protein n=1 Tax=Anguilla anguilla TaxID=7936 RepID=A0A0E9QBH9_ANGAN
MMAMSGSPSETCCSMAVRCLLSSCRRTLAAQP